MALAKLCPPEARDLFPIFPQLTRGGLTKTNRAIICTWAGKRKHVGPSRVFRRVVHRLNVTVNAGRITQVAVRRGRRILARQGRLHFGVMAWRREVGAH